MAEDTPENRKRLEEEARKLGEVLKKNLSEGVGFVLVLYDYGIGGSMTFLSTGDRDDTIEMLSELLTILRKKTEPPVGKN